MTTRLRPILLFVLALLLPLTPTAAASLTFTVTASEPVTVTGTPRLAIDLGGVTRYASYTAGSGTAALSFSYAVQPGDFDANGITLASPLDLNGGSITDIVGNPVPNLAFTLPDTSALKVQTYTTAFLTNSITNANASAVSFRIAKAPTGASFTYTITSSGGAGSVTGSGTISGATHTVSGVDVSALPLGNLTLSAVVSTPVGGTGAASAASAIAYSFTGVLDSLPAAAAAFSTRRLTGAYAGPLFRVRRTSDTAVRDIGATSSGNLDTAALTGFCGGSSCYLTIWYDQSGNGRNAQAVSGSAPRIVDAGTVDVMGSRPAVRFLANATAFTAPAPLANANEYSLFLTTVELARVGITTWQLLASTSGESRVLTHMPWYDDNFYYDQGSAFVPNRISMAWPVAVGTPVVASFHNSASAGTRRVYLNGASLISGTGLTAPSDSLSFGNRCLGNIGELILFPSSVSASARQTLERSQGSYFGISVQ